MSALQMPPLAVLLDPEQPGMQLLVVPVGHLGLPDAVLIEVATVWAAQQSAN
jgi:hypothetical protein